MESNGPSAALIRSKKLSILYLVLLLIGVSVSIYLAQKLDTTNKELIREKNALKAAKDSLVQLNNAYLSARDSIAILANLLNDEYVRKEDPLAYEKNKIRIESVTQTSQSQYLIARELEIKAFNYILNNDLNNAMVTLNTINSVYPTYHCSMEIYNLLNKNKEKLKNESTIREIKKTILSKYTYGAPDSILRKMKEQVQ